MLSEHDKVKCIRIYLDSPHNKYVATVGNGTHLEFVESEKEIMENARLIAAAPELLEALIWLKNQIPNLQGEISIFGMQKVEATIAKATGLSTQS